MYSKQIVILFSAYSKAVTEDGNLIYMSRAPILYNKSKSFQKGWRQVCYILFRLNRLKYFQNQKNTIEKIEDLELNRFVEIGYDVKMIEMSDKSIAVDTIEDIKKLTD